MILWLLHIISPKQTRCYITPLQTSGLTPTSHKGYTACHLLTAGTQSPASPRAWPRLLQALSSWLLVRNCPPYTPSFLHHSLYSTVAKWFMAVPGGSGAGVTPGDGYEGTVGGYLQQHHAQLAFQQQGQLQQLQQLHHYQQHQYLQYQQQQQVCGPKHCRKCRKHGCA